MMPNTSERLLSVKEFAERTGVDRQTVYRNLWSNPPKIPFVRVGTKSIRIPESFIRTFCRYRNPNTGHIVL